MWSFLVFLILSLIFSFEMIKNVQKKKFFCRLKILSTRNISESNFSKLRFWTVDKYIFIYGEDIYLLRSCSTWLANMINLI